MDLALPKFDGLGDRPAQARKPWMVSTDSPVSPDPGCSTDLVRSPSPCLNLDALSSDDAEESVRPRDISVTLLCGSEDTHTPVNSDQVLSDVDLPTAAGSRDRRQVFRTHVICLRMIGIPDGQCVWDTRRIVQMSGCSIPLAFRHRLRKSGRTLTPRDYQPPVPPRWSDQSIYRRWDG